MADNAFVGVDPMYQGYADVTGKPFFSGDKEEKALEVAQQESTENAKIELNEVGLPVYKGPIFKEAAPAVSEPSLAEQVIDIVEAREAAKAAKSSDEADAAKPAAAKASTAKTAATKAADVKPEEK